MPGAMRSNKGGSISAFGGTSGAFFDFKVEGVEKTSEEFKLIRRDIGGRMRDTVVKVGEREIVPLIRSMLPRKKATEKRGLPVAKMADSIYVKRDRTTVVIGSRLTGKKNRALGWIDFGGKRSGDTVRRSGPHAIVTGIERKRGSIDDSVLAALIEEFHRSGFEVS